MKKIMIITDAWAPQVNGAVTILEKMVMMLKQTGYSVSVVHPGLFVSMPLFFYPEINVALFPRKKLERSILDMQPDHIHIATEGSLGFSARSICLKKGFKFTTSYHTHFPEYIRIRIGMFYYLTYRYLSWFHNAGVTTLVNTESIKKDLDIHGFTKTKIWPPGVDTKLFTRADSSNKLKTDLIKPIFVYFGRIAVEKNVEEFLMCDLPGTKLVIGDGPLRKKIEKKYGRTVKFVGYKRGKDLVHWLSQCDVCIFPSLTDTFGLVIIEALACGIPVAAHDVIGPKDIITHGVDGYLDTDLLRAAVACLKLSQDACRQKALTYSWENSLEIFIATLVKV